MRNVDFEDGLEEAHVHALIQVDQVLHDEDLRGRGVGHVLRKGK